MRNARRMLHTLVLALMLAGTAVTAVPQAHAASLEAAQAQMEIIEKNTTLTKNTAITSDCRMTAGTLKLGGRTLDVSGDFYLQGGKIQLNGGTLNIRGNLYVSSGELRVIYGKVNVEGSVIQSGGKVQLNSGSLTTGKHYYLAVPKNAEDGSLTWQSSRGILTMLYGGCSMNVGGDLYIDSAYGPNFQAGVLTVCGNITQIGTQSSAKMKADPAHKVVLKGEAPQTIALENPESSFGRLDVVNTEGVVVTDYFAATSLTAPKSEVKLLSEGAIFGNVVLDVPRFLVTGDVFQMGNLDLNRSTMQVNGSLIQTDGDVCVEYGTLDITEDYCLATPIAVEAAAAEGEETAEEAAAPATEWSYSYGKLVMTNPSGKVKIGGSFYMNAAEGVDCQTGTITVAGDFVQKVDYPTKRFQAKNGHTVILNGTQPQTVTLMNEGSSFAVLEVANESGIIVTDYFAAESLKAPGGEVKIQSENAVFESITLNVPKVTVTGDVIQNGNLNLKNGTFQVNGNLFQTNGDVHVAQGTMTISGDYYMASPQETEDGELTWVSSYGKLVMNHKKANVLVGGSLYLDDEKALECTLGTVTVGGTAVVLDAPNPKAEVQGTEDRPFLLDRIATVNYQQAYLSYYRRNPDLSNKFHHIAPRPRTVWLAELSGNYHKDMLCPNVAVPEEVNIKANVRLVEDAMRYNYKACEVCYPNELPWQQP